ncbi:hypothetical protein [Edaphobacter modestus]|uniref:hypothetical protein n=1 Tax=Edaphobacter modestus TaxID=388466 RepID=UPI0013EEAB84|nr:hypothetical protein [Edaphobacter modestus]
MPVSQNHGASPVLAEYGMALQVLGDAAHHLVSCSAYSDERGGDAAENEAIRILLKRSREVFEEYAKVLGWPASGAPWLTGQTARGIGSALVRHNSC